jgi:hypothetical protein
VVFFKDAPLIELSNPSKVSFSSVLCGKKESSPIVMNAEEELERTFNEYGNDTFLRRAGPV